MLKQFFKAKSDFVVKEINSTDKIVVVEDPSLGLECQVPIGEGELTAAEITGEYKIKLTYADGRVHELTFLN